MNAEWKSESIDKLAPALLAAQKELQPAIKDCRNPAFKSKYADLNSCLDAVYAAFHPHGLSVVQEIEPHTFTNCGGGPAQMPGILVVTRVMHESGEWIGSRLPMMPDMANPQKIGGCITYGRRYGLAAIAGLTQEDDDGETANGRGPGHDYDRQPANGNGNGHGAARNGDGGNRMPTNGRQLFAWAKDMGERCGLDVVKWLDRYGQQGNLPGEYTEWSESEVKAAADAAVAAINKRALATHGKGEAAD